MKFLMSRFGGHSVTIGKGKSSDSNLPEDQSLDNMLDHYAQEIIPNYFIISSYDAKPEWMGSLKWQDFSKKPVSTFETKKQDVPPDLLAKRCAISSTKERTSKRISITARSRSTTTGSRETSVPWLSAARIGCLSEAPKLANGVPSSTAY